MNRNMLTALVALTLLASGCAGEWSADAHAPADYKSTYKKLVDTCEKSSPHGGKYVYTWADPTVDEAWKAKKTLPEGSVFIKEAFADSGCSEPTEHFVMKKTGSTGDVKDWNWQTLDEYGALNQSDQSQMSGCAGCHTGYKANDYVGTPAPATGT